MPQNNQQTLTNSEHIQYKKITFMNTNLP